MTNTLDLVITEGRERVYELEQGKLLGDAESGNVSISWCYGLAAGNIKGETNKRFTSNKYNYRRGDYKGMNEYLRGKDWETLFSGAGVQEKYEILLGE
ncbi:RNA-directed DNA polymerase from mobile element jockey-like [Brachionus plicatilis]|uniref:RNA-directed DNA polymerase from mobile element jockey-like n=1 Tax=Brachionus plicatilis TaxID=10195 RepID=A0A3M7RLY7_BRAPC|nr:RNA-directed DNA polymerase from mobile element jockey-like [Brachionus plicatilis]